jgi:hypothetical protein
MHTYHAVARDKLLWFDVPTLETGGILKVKAPARRIQIVLIAGESAHEILLPDLHFQDFCHLGAKLRVRLCGRNGHGLTIGAGRAVVELLRNEATSALWLQLAIDVHIDDFDPKRDPMNLPAFFRLISPGVLALLTVCSHNHPPPLHRISVTTTQDLSLPKIQYV